MTVTFSAAHSANGEQVSNYHLMPECRISLLLGHESWGMLSIGFVITPGFPVMSLAALSVFEFANDCAQEKLYDLQVLSETGESVASSAGTRVDTKAFGDTHFDTLIIGGNTRIVPTSPKLLSYVQGASSASRRISSICTGAFTLGDAGLLAGRRVTTHWLFTKDLSQRFPDIYLQENHLFTVDGSIWTAAGNSAGIDLTLYMLETDYGHELALKVAKILVVDYQRSGGQSQHSALLGINPKSDRIQDALAYARRNMRTALSIEMLAQVAGLSPRQFSRAFRDETGMSPAKAVESIRLEAARRMTEQSRHPVEVIAIETGFGDQERMRRAFLRVFGHPPQAIRRMANGNGQR